MTNRSSTTTSSSSSSDCSSSDSESDSETSSNTQDPNALCKESQLENMVQLLVHELEECITHFPEHYKSIYCLVHHCMHVAEKFRDLHRCKQLMLSQYKTSLMVCLPIVRTIIFGVYQVRKLIVRAVSWCIWSSVFSSWWSYCIGATNICCWSIWQCSWTRHRIRISEYWEKPNVFWKVGLHNAYIQNFGLHNSVF